MTIVSKKDKQREGEKHMISSENIMPLIQSLIWLLAGVGVFTQIFFSMNKSMNEFTVGQYSVLNDNF